MKALCTDLLYENSVTNTMILTRFISKVKGFVKKELMALVLMAFIKSSATAGGMILMSDVRASDTAICKPWKRNLNQLLIVKGGILIALIQGFVSV